LVCQCQPANEPHVIVVPRTSGGSEPSIMESIVFPGAEVWMVFSRSDSGYRRQRRRKAEGIGRLGRRVWTRRHILSSVRMLVESGRLPQGVLVLVGKRRGRVRLAPAAEARAEMWKGKHSRGQISRGRPLLANDVSPDAPVCSVSCVSSQKPVIGRSYRLEGPEAYHLIESPERNASPGPRCRGSTEQDGRIDECAAALMSIR